MADYFKSKTGGTIDLDEVAHLFAPEDTCPQNNNGLHQPDWNTIQTDYDGETLYVDVCCRHCGKSGCIGTQEQLVDMITWNE